MEERKRTLRCCQEVLRPHWQPQCSQHHGGRRMKVCASEGGGSDSRATYTPEGVERGEVERCIRRRAQLLTD